MIEITEVRHFSDGVCRVKFTVKFPKMGMEIRDCGFFESGDKKWIGLPSKPYEKDGQKKYYNLVMFTPEMKKKFDDAVMVEVAKVIKPREQKEDYSMMPF